MLVGSGDWGKEEVHQVVTWRTNVKGEGPGRPMTLRDFHGCRKKGAIRRDRRLANVPGVRPDRAENLGYYTPSCPLPDLPAHE